MKKQSWKKEKTTFCDVQQNYARPISGVAWCGAGKPGPCCQGLVHAGSMIR
jgi:hypothetical protein